RPNTYTRHSRHADRIKGTPPILRQRGHRQAVGTMQKTNSAITGFLSLVIGANMVCASPTTGPTSASGGMGGGSALVNTATANAGSAAPTLLSDNASSNIVVWVDDSLPSGATSGSDGGDSWNWVSSNPSPFAGSLAHQSSLSSGLHQHYFYSASQTLPI